MTTFGHGKVIIYGVNYISTKVSNQRKYLLNYLWVYYIISLEELRLFYLICIQNKSKKRVLDKWSNLYYTFLYSNICLYDVRRILSS